VNGVLFKVNFCPEVFTKPVAVGEAGPDDVVVGLVLVVVGLVVGAVVVDVGVLVDGGDEVLEPGRH
jgi:hypothetical protein